MNAGEIWGHVLMRKTGYPIATLPLGYLDFNGRPHGLAAIPPRTMKRH